MALEIERRFIVRASDDLLQQGETMELRQGYLTELDSTTVRIRQEGTAWVLAIKADATGIARHEIEVEVPAEDGRTLMDLAVGGTVEKRRHTIGRWEIDVYAGRFAGLTLAEVELEAEDEPLPDPPPGLELIREVTNTLGLSSRSLARLDEAGARALVQRLTAG